MRKKPWKKMGKRVLFYLFSLLLVMIYAIPIWMVFVNSFKSRREANLFGIELPYEWALGNYAEVFESGNILSAFMNGMIIASGAVVLILLCSSMAAFVIARSHKKLIKGAYFLFLIGIVVPIAFIPTYLVLNQLQLLNSYLGIILLHATYGLPASIFLYSGFVNTIPRELDEAAIMDGARLPTLYMSVIFPLLKPITSTLFIFNFVGAWNDVQLPLFFTGSDKWTLPLTMYNFYGAKSSSWNLIFADIMLTIAPLLVIYLVAQRYIIEGMTAGAVKG
ncbi:carbohydrate ABC transporter permease [uncultured Robinsoniella sp.]|uniref:carbohydrate ABC transporter permease n=1 Tax=uncultured Robinsoniella sp. TaxID=904190 RepID=UPI00374EECDD